MITSRVMLRSIIILWLVLLRGVQRIVQSFVTHTRHLFCLFSILAGNVQKLPGLILTYLKFATRHHIKIVSKNKWIFHLIFGLKYLMWRKQLSYDHCIVLHKIIRRQYKCKMDCNTEELGDRMVSV